MIVSGVPIPPTERQRLFVRINQAAYEALFRYLLPNEIRAYSVHPCPGQYDCKAPRAWIGSFSCGEEHRYYHTNHKR